MNFSIHFYGFPQRWHDMVDSKEAYGEDYNYEEDPEVAAEREREMEAKLERELTNELEEDTIRYCTVLYCTVLYCTAPA